jgi:uncharacterized RDD family membrane protein YckC
MEQEEYIFASFGQRLIARIIDVIIVAIISEFIFVVFFSEYFISSRMIDQQRRGISILVFYFLYQPLLESAGGTFGKKIIGFKTINISTGQAPSILNSYGRSLINLMYFMLFVIPAMLSGLAVLWSKKKQTWHDSSSNIIVVKNI